MKRIETMYDRARDQALAAITEVTSYKLEPETKMAREIVEYLSELLSQLKEKRAKPLVLEVFQAMFGFRKLNHDLSGDPVDWVRDQVENLLRVIAGNQRSVDERNAATDFLCLWHQQLVERPRAAALA